MTDTDQYRDRMNVMSDTIMKFHEAQIAVTFAREALARDMARAFADGVPAAVIADRVGLSRVHVYRLIEQVGP